MSIADFAVGRLRITPRRDDSVEWWMIDGRDCQISLEPRPHYCDRGNWVAKLHVTAPDPNVLWIDAADGWPRYYFDLDRALAEIEAWLTKRGQLP